MRKYLIKGALALFAGTLVLGCAEKESEYVPVAQQKVKAFEDVFKEVYGNNIDPYQDWGFEHAKTGIDVTDESQIVEAKSLYGDVAYTRAAAFGHNGALLAFQSGTRTANPNKNLWGDPDEMNLKIPPALTPGQKIRVKAYFQHHPNITYQAPACGDYYIQQVYKGYNDYETYLRPNKDCSLEYYYAANNDTVIGSGHMDKLTIGSNEEHVLNFNYGTYDFGRYHQVLNEGESSHDYLGTYTENPGKTHADQITLMQNICPTCVGFHDSQGQVQHNDHAALVAASVIDQWARDHQADLVASGEFGEDCVTPGWDRSFVGLDYESRVPEDIYLKNNGQKIYAKVSDCCPQKDFVWDGTKYWKWDDIKDRALTTPDGRTFPLISTDKNQYLGTYVKIDQNNMYSTVKAGPIKRDTGLDNIYGDTNDDRDVQVVDLTKIFSAIGSGAVAAVNNDKGGFVKNLGGRDYVFSDWIVTLTKAQSYPPPYDDYEITNTNIWGQVERGRVFCEDLGRSAREDLDYNDVVFDAIVFSNYRYYKKVKVRYRDSSKTTELSRVTEEESGPTTKYYVNVKLLAAGGTIPVSVLIGPKESDDLKEYVVHDQFNDPAPTATETMVNTRDNNSTAYGSFDTRKPVQLGDIHETFVVTYQDGSTENFDVKLIEVPESIAHIRDINIWSCFNGGSDVAELQSVKGGTPQKFMAPIGTKWPSERNNISLAYPGEKDANGNIIKPGFNDWVKDRSNVPWAYVNSRYVYSEENPYDPNGRNLPLVMRVESTIISESEQELWNGTQTYGSDWGLANLAATLDIDQFHAGDRLRFYATNIPIPTNGQEFTDDNQKAWITVVIGSITPYFINTEFPYYVVQNGERVFKESGCIEVVLDQAAADLLNPYISGGKVTFQVQGRNFTLTRISRLVQ